MYYISVITIKDNVVDQNELFTGKTESEVIEKAQKRFIEICKNDKCFNPIFTDIVLDNGFYEFESSLGNSVCITWPTVMDT